MTLLRCTLLALAVVAACASDPQTQSPPPAGPPTPLEGPAEEPKPTRAKRRFDVQGNLLPSETYVAGVRLPRGAELSRATELTHVYRIQAPIDKVLAYFGPMMITGNVERRGKGAVYRRASVRGAEVNPTKVDVSILEVGSNLVRISVTELPPPPQHVESSEHTKAAARDAWRRLD